MKKIRLTELSEDARRLLADAEQGGGLVVEDERGKTSRVYAYPEPTEAERQTALDGLKGFQKKVQQSFDEQGVSEDDLDQLLQEDE
jgi:hypothetical protein